jgi:hypothetical protein
MKHREGIANRKLILIAVVMLSFKGVMGGQDLESKLAYKTDFVPKSTSALEQLIEVVQYHHIPVGIEWVNQPEGTAPQQPYHKSMSIKELITAILPLGYRAQVTDGVLHIAQPALAADPRNFLNLRIREFEVDKVNLFGAEASLRLRIDMTLHPERFSGGGWVGGHGNLPTHGWDIRNITFSGKNLTVREILNKIAVANGNALWVVRLIPSEMMANAPFYAQALNESGEAYKDFYWRFLPLRNIKEDK